MRAFGLLLNRIRCRMIPTTWSSTSQPVLSPPSLVECFTFLSTNIGFFRGTFDPVSSWYPTVKVCTSWITRTINARIGAQKIMGRKENLKFICGWQWGKKVKFFVFCGPEKKNGRECQCEGFGESLGNPVGVRRRLGVQQWPIPGTLLHRSCNSNESAFFLCSLFSSSLSLSLSWGQGFRVYWGCFWRQRWMLFPRNLFFFFFWFLGGGGVFLIFFLFK